MRGREMVPAGVPRVYSTDLLDQASGAAPPSVVSMKAVVLLTPVEPDPANKVTVRSRATGQ